ncbi:CDP-glucose 4,6-dehydratase [Legionella sp. D16C41]|uniref:CDP-glucose 4,6-dehydratase n=1 Tax=Legionella sp. D16C41 TaxID=3402688 RepID=UPI003AF6C415
MNFWQGRKVFLTGHTGFKGSWLALWLQLLEARVTGLALSPPTTPSLFELADVASGMTSVIADIRNFDSVYQAFKEYEPEIVIHMAAQPLVRASYQIPIETYATNVLGTVHVLEAARQVGSVKTIVNITTDKCYENQEWHWGYRENDKLGGYDPYSNSKACAELVTNAYRSSYFNDTGIGLASARAGNVIGGGDWAEDRLIPDIMRACIKQNPILIRNPHSIRPWQHVLEPLYGYLLLAEKLHKDPACFAQGWNFGPNEADAKPVDWIVDFIVRHWGQQASWYLDDKKHLHEATYLKLDCSKAKSQLNWQPQWTLEKGLLETISWYQAFQASENMRTKTVNQILSFLENLKS